MSWAFCIASLGGLGKAPFAPGTVATIVAGIPFALLLGYLPGWLACSIFLAILIGGCYTAGVTERELGREDAKEVVIDELAGFLVSVMGLPVGIRPLLLGFILFRLLDIWKPWPISPIDERVKGGLGIMLDDLLAGMFALAINWTVLKFLA